MEYMQDNYLSVVILLQHGMNQIQLLSKVRLMDEFLRNHFKHYEFILVDNNSLDNMDELIEKVDLKCSIVRLSRTHKPAQGMEAGIDCAIGDYILEIENINCEFSVNEIWEMYIKCQGGSDFVCLTPRRQRKTSKIFYSILNHFIKYETVEKIRSAIAIMSSRRGQNKVSAMGNKIVNRNVTYAMSGLRCTHVYTDVVYHNRRGFFINISLMADTLIYYTDFMVKFMVMMSMVFLTISIGMGIYSIISYFSENIADGWTSIIVFISFGFSGIFAMLAIISKYLDHILKNTSDSKNYVFSEIIKK